MVLLQQKFAGISREDLERFSEDARSAVALRGEVNILIADDEQLRRLNRRFRRRNKPTDVLSFLGSGDGVAGDIAISAEMAVRNARALGHNLAEELHILILHGMLHLAGYDHQRDTGEMSRRERALRQQFSLPASLTERARRARRRETKSRR